MTVFAAALAHVGLSTSEAAEYLSAELGRSISPEAVRKMSSGHQRVWPDVWACLSELFISQIEAAEKALTLMDELADTHGDPDELDLSIGPRDQTWPSQRAAYAVKALVALMSGIPVADETK